MHCMAAGLIVATINSSSSARTLVVVRVGFVSGADFHRLWPCNLGNILADARINLYYHPKLQREFPDTSAFAHTRHKPTIDDRTSPIGIGNRLFPRMLVIAVYKCGFVDSGIGIGRQRVGHEVSE